MTPATIVMICLICVGCAIGIAGILVATVRILRFVKAARKAGISTREDAKEVIRKVRDLGPRIQDTQRKYEVVAERLKSLSATTGKLNYLRDELDQATHQFSRLKF